MRIAVLASLVLGAFSAGQAQTIELPDLLESVRADHPRMRREARAIELGREAYRRSLASQDWRLASAATYTYWEPTEEDPFTPDVVQNSDLQVSLERPFWSTGGRFALSAGETYRDANLESLDLGGIVIPLGRPYTYETSAYLTYSQPLWRNRGGTLDRLDAELANDAVTWTAIRAREAQEKFLLDIGLRFLDWALLHEQQGIAAERLRLAQEQLAQVSRRREMNLVEEVDLLRARDAVHTAEQGALQIEARYRARRAALAEITQRQDLYDLIPEHDLYAPAALPSADDAVDDILNRTRLMRSLDVAQQQLERQQAAAADAYDPDVTLDLGYGLRRKEGDLGDALGVSKTDAYVALNFRMPLGRRAAKSDVERTRLQMMQLADERREAAIQLESALRALLIEIEQLAEVMRLDLTRIKSAEQKAAEELRLYNQGRGQLTFVINARDQVEQAQFDYAQNAFAYQTLLLQYRELMDELLPDAAEDPF